MKFWVYSIDWRSMAIEIIAECKNEREAELEHGRYLASLSGPQLVEMTQFKTLDVTPVSPQMMAAVEQFKRMNGRAAG